MHELIKLDAFLGVADGTSYLVLTSRSDPHILNKKLIPHGIALDGNGMVPEHQRGQWKALIKKAGLAKKYWKDPDLLIE